MIFQSILYRQGGSGRAPEPDEAPAFLHDLNIDQIVAAVTAGRDEYDLSQFFECPLDDIEEITYRQQVMQDLERADLLDAIVTFVGSMREMRSLLRSMQQAYYRPHRNGWFLEAATVYCRAVPQLLARLTHLEPQSRGLQSFCEYLLNYAESETFTSFAARTEQVAADLGSLKYSILIRGLAVTVRKYENETDYSAEIEQSFAKFRQGDVKDYRLKLTEYAAVGHVETQILEMLTKLYPEIFDRFEQYCLNYTDFFDPILKRFDREVQFYVSYLQFIRGLKRAGLCFCYPKLTRQHRTIFGNGVFDLALAAKLAGDGDAIVPNDFYLADDERVLVISGPNQGGKTTFARTLGQLHYFASLGCAVPGSSAQVPLCDRILTHFTRQESIADLRGKLADDLLRIRKILRQATPSSLVIMNEVFSSTALADAVFLATEIMRRILEFGCLCVCVTFIDEVANLGGSVVSMVSTVDPDDPALRTFTLVRRPADGCAYAMAIAEKHRLDYRSLKQRLAP